MTSNFGKLDKCLEKSKFVRKSDFMKALSEFILKERFLLENDINERSLTHKLAEYLQKHFPDYNVDCEYNRMTKNEEQTKKILYGLLTKIDEKTDFDIKDIKPTMEDKKQTTVYPDITIHRRISDRNNMLVIEVKKTANVSKERKDFDFQKLTAFTKELKYRFGLYLEFDEKDVADNGFAIFKNGKKFCSPENIKYGEISRNKFWNNRE